MKLFEKSIVILSFLFITVSCSEERPIEKSITSFYTAFFQADFDTAKKYCTQESTTHIDSYRTLFSKPLIDKVRKSTIDVIVQDITLNATQDTATVQCLFNGYWNLYKQKIENNLKAHVKVIKQEGSWKVVYP